MLRFLKIISALAILILLAIPNTIHAQQSELAKVDFSTIKVDKLTDAQVKQFINRAKSTGMTMQQLEAQAISRGMPYSEVLKLRERIVSLDTLSEKTEDQSTKNTRETDQKTDFKIFEEEEKDSEDKIQFFGYDLFQQKQLTFEPSLSIPTPQNYQLSAGDELLIEVWGASQSSFQLKINPEGQVIIPNLGPIQINGLTVEKASSLIISKLSTIYSGLKGNSPNTFAQISLGNLRSIKVTITGDVFMPGTFTLPSLATVFNALYIAGGPNIKGSFREIKVMRNAIEIANIDLYEFLLNGKTSLNIRLNDEDVIFVGPTQNRVTFTGEVHRPAIYETKNSETLADLIGFAGGFSPNAYSKNLVVNRKTDSQRKLLNVEKDLFSSFLISNGDSIQVGEVLKRYENRVTIQGAVFREGEYALSEGLTVSELVKRAEGIREDAFTNRVAIYRLGNNLEMSVVDINLHRILNGEDKDIALQREDLVIISSQLDLKQEQTVSIDGEVQKPDTYPYAHNISLGELIRSAGGFNEAASLARINVARRVQNPTALKSDDKITEVFSFALDKNLS
ncbi:MAG: SLBB domain-containing protein, partial [Tenuifilaceae bacterium]|nr:SLBB domain-containing protein [Tenuifilaceae bacterium]